MESKFSESLKSQIDRVYADRPDLVDHRKRFPWLTGALGDPYSGIWFVGENPSLGQVERVQDPLGGPATSEAQWWSSKGDRLFRDLLARHGFKDAPIESHGGWHCYITNAIKYPDYAEKWRGSAKSQQRAAADIWAPVLEWELRESNPRLIVTLGKTVLDILNYLSKQGLAFPEIKTVQHYSYVALRPRGKEGPMHPNRVNEYNEEFRSIQEFFVGNSAT